MLFNSLEFLLLFLPLCVVPFYIIAQYSQKAALSYLLLCSLLFYSVWNPVYIGLLLSSIAINFILGHILQKKPSKSLMAGAILLNLSSIAYFKYMDFFIDISNQTWGTNVPMQNIILPLGISFFTFQQIAYIIECYRGQIRSNNFLSYALFVSFFPQLIAGPIVRFQEIVPQFLAKPFGKVNWNHIIIGLIIFSIGLSKKVFLADSMAVQAHYVFDKALNKDDLDFISAWFGSFAYSFQIYFDFSAYSDMAIGLGLMLGLSLPVNFLSPYKARNIIEFWRRWHITLSRFLRDYLYFPLGGNRKGPFRRYLNLIIVMLLGGLWHGASWNFVIWGGIHGLYLMINHGMQALSQKHSPTVFQNDVINTAITFLCVTIAWVFFRAETLESALYMIHIMIFPDIAALSQTLMAVPELIATLFPCACIIWLMPNAMTIKNTLEKRLKDQIPLKKTIALPLIFSSLGLAFSTYFIFAGVYSEFIYFQF